MPFDKLRNASSPCDKTESRAAFNASCFVFLFPFLFSEPFNPSVFTLYMPIVRFVKRFPPAFGKMPKEKPNSACNGIRFYGRIFSFLCRY